MDAAGWYPFLVRLPKTKEYFLTNYNQLWRMTPLWAIHEETGFRLGSVTLIRR